MKEMPHDPREGLSAFRKRTPLYDIEAAMTEGEQQEWHDLRDRATALDKERAAITARINILRMRASQRHLSAIRRATRPASAAGKDEGAPDA